MGLELFDCPPDVAVVGLGKPACVVVVSGLRNHATPSLVQGVEGGARFRTGVRGAADTALTALCPDNHLFQFRVPPRDLWLCPACPPQHRNLNGSRDHARDGRYRSRGFQVVRVQAPDMIVEEAPIGVVPVPVLDGSAAAGVLMLT
jgi:hypothetical protein